MQYRPPVGGSWAYVEDFEWNKGEKDLNKLDALLYNEKMFGVDLMKNSIAKTVREYFKELSCGPRAVRAILEKYVK